MDPPAISCRKTASASRGRFLRAPTRKDRKVKPLRIPHARRFSSVSLHRSPAIPNDFDLSRLTGAGLCCFLMRSMYESALSRSIEEAPRNGVSIASSADRYSDGAVGAGTFRSVIGVMPWAEDDRSAAATAPVDADSSEMELAWAPTAAFFFLFAVDGFCMT